MQTVEKKNLQKRNIPLSTSIYVIVSYIITTFSNYMAYISQIESEKYNRIRDKAVFTVPAYICIS